MANRGLLLWATWALPFLLVAQQRLNAVVETKRFHEPGKGELVDINTSILGSTVLWTMDERGFVQAQVDALITLEQGDKIIDYRKAKVASPERADTLQGDFIYNERFLLQPGSYAITVALRDANLADTARTYVHAPLVIAERGANASLSDIMFTLPSDEGQGIRPYPGTYYPQEVTKLGSYAEAYGTMDRFGKDGLFLAVIQIENYEGGQVAGNFRQVQRLKADTIVPLGVEFGIGKLPSGNYLLVVELRDRNDSLVQRRTQFFQRNNPVDYDPGRMLPGELGPNFTDAYTDPDTLLDHLSSMRPVADELERKMIDDQVKNKDPEVMRQIMYTFWYNRGPADPQAAWERYLEAVKYVNRQFGCRNMRGYQSDQGYVYLRYGAPNTVVNRTHETGVVPYMIWHYYRAGRYNDRRFVFYQPERSTTCWTLLTSDMPGELNDSRWLDRIVSGAADAGAKRNEVLDNYKNPH